MNLFRMVFVARREFPRVVPLLRHAGVPLWSKAAALAAAALVVSPLDLLGDIPVLGLVDDAVLLALLAHLFVGYAERSAAASQPGTAWPATTAV